MTEKKPRAWNSTLPQRTSWMKSTPKPLRGVGAQGDVSGKDTPRAQFPNTPRRSTLKRRSKKRAAQELVYPALRAAYLAQNPFCARCPQFATEIHHKAGRRGELLLYMDLWIGLCHGCHQWVTEHPRAALDAGFSLPRTRSA